ncbi:hypothetical protein KKP97_02600 [Methanothermococcus sp. SCGC AD-155-C09]|nr:hypothetical protein [Methanothermococcus sp. SCGC AD-155-C09]
MEISERERKIKKLLHTLKHTEEHFEELITSIEENGLNAEPYIKIYNMLKDENNKLKEILTNKN